MIQLALRRILTSVSPTNGPNSPTNGPNSGALFMGLLILAFGLFQVIVANSEADWARRLRQSVRWGKGPDAAPVSQLGCLVGSVSWMLFGMAAILDGYFQLLGPRVTPVMIFAAGIIYFAAAICDASDHKKRERRSRAVRNGLCPRCGYDMRATPRRCPECGEQVGSDEVKSAQESNRQA